MRSSFYKGWFDQDVALALGAAITFAFGCYWPQQLQGEVLSCVAVILLAALGEYPHLRYRVGFVFGFVFSLLAYYWLPQTLQHFGGFPFVVGFLLHALLALVSSVQFFFCVWLKNRLPKQLHDWRLAFPLAWLVSEFLVPRLFPWYLCHPFIGLKWFSNLAQLVGVAPLSVLLLWWVAVSLSVLKKVQLPSSTVKTCYASLVCLLALGAFKIQTVSNEIAQAQKVQFGIVQGNLSTKEKGHVEYLEANLERYQEISNDAVAHGAEILIWPETVASEWTPEAIQSVADTKFDPFPRAPRPLIYGSLSFRTLKTERYEELLKSRIGDYVRAHPDEYKYQMFNAGLARDTSGLIQGRYYKRALMPFGEYLPLSDIFPQVKALSPYSGQFTSGDLTAPLELQIRNTQTQNTVEFAPRVVRAATLICYEDLISSLSRQAVVDGANVLVNLTNDAWYGNSAAPFQHHLLAAWRAIETGRFLIRATNTGLTAVVSPLGETVKQLPVFQEGYFVASIALLEGKTFYTRFGDSLSWTLIIIALIFALKPRPRA